MGFDIYALDFKGSRVDGAEFDDLEEVAYLRAYMGAFRMCREQGYDWFKLIDAMECDGGVSGSGIAKFIMISDLQNALSVLETHETLGKLSREGRDEWTHRKPLLRKFMISCIEWCEENDMNKILILFR